MEKLIKNIRPYINGLINLPVSLAWKGYGSQIYLEIGRLTPLENVRQHHENGEACISADWDWRIEKDKKILFGSSNSGPQIDRGLNEGSLIESISISGEVPELEMIFTGNLRLKSMVMLTGDPECG